MGLAFALLSLLQLVLYNAANVYANIWLSRWTEDPVFSDSSNSTSEEKSDAVNKYLGVYGGLGAVQSKNCYSDQPSIIRLDIRATW